MRARVVLVVALLTLTPRGSVVANLLLTQSSGRELLSTSARQLVVERELLGRRLTRQASSMQALAARVAPISRHAVLKYGGDWKAYSAASNLRNQRAGKTLEAVFAWRANAQRARLGIPDRMLVTAAEGFPSHPADLVDIASDGTVIRKYQCKWGWKSALKALLNPKYDGMTILTTRESYATIERKLLAEEAKALRRGIPLHQEWQVARDAINSGRLPQMVAGKPLPAAAAVQRLDELIVRSSFTHPPRNVAGLEPAVLRVPGSTEVFLGRALLVVDVAVTGYVQYQDVNRYREGRISGRYLVFKSTLRASQLTLTTYAVFSPEPGSKFIAGMASAVLVGVDLASESIYQRRRDAAAAVLSSVDREERYHAARGQLLSREW